MVGSRETQAVPLTGCCILVKKKNKEEKKVLDYYDGSVFVITAIMTYDDENKINDIYFTCFGISRPHFFFFFALWDLVSFGFYQTGSRNIQDQSKVMMKMC